MAIISAHQSVYDRAFFNGLYDFTNQIEKQKDIYSTHSILNFQIPYFTNVGVINIPAIHYNDPSQYTNDSLRIVKNEILTNHLISNDHKSVCVFINFQENLGKGDYLQILNSIRQLGNAMNFKEFYLIGPKVIETTYSELMLKELKNLGLVLFLVMVVLLSTIFRSFKIVFIILLILISSLIISYGLLGFLNVRLEILSNIIPVLILVTCINNCLHMLFSYKLDMVRFEDADILAGNTIYNKGLDVMVANLTTAIGFGLLYFSYLPAIRNLGLIASFVIVVTFIVNMVWFTYLLPRKDFYLLISTSNDYHQLISSIAIDVYQTLKQQKLMLATIALVIGISILGIFFIDTNNKVLKNIPHRYNLKQGMIHYEEKFGGFRTYNLMITPMGHDNNKLDKYLMVTDTISTLLKNETGISHILALSELRDYLNNQKNGIKESTLKYVAIKSGILNNQSGITRVTARLKDIGRINTEEIRIKLEPVLHQLEESYNLKIVNTGDDYLFDLAHKYRITNMFYGLAFSMAIISIVLLILYKKTKYFILSVCANILPLLMAAGLMGWLKIELRGATSILFTIGFAIAIDDTIHFISQYRRTRYEENVDDRITKTLNSVGVPIVLSSIILGSGFLVMIFSELWDLRMFGWLVSVFVLFATITDILVLPVLISKWDNNEKNAV